MSISDQIFGLSILIAVLSFTAGLFAGFGLDSDTTPATSTEPVATVTIAPSGMAYCPDDPLVPHPTPCENRP